MKDSDLISKKSSSDSENLVKNKVPEMPKDKRTKAYKEWVSKYGQEVSDSSEIPEMPKDKRTKAYKDWVKQYGASTISSSKPKTKSSKKESIPKKEKYTFSDLVSNFIEIIESNEWFNRRKEIEELRSKINSILKSESDTEKIKKERSLFFQTLKNYSFKKKKYFKELNSNQKANLEKRKDLIEKIKNLIIVDQNPNKLYSDFKILKEEWHNTGQVPINERNNIWETYRHHVGKFYDFLHLNRDLRELDFKHNYEEKVKIIEKAEELDKLDDIIKASRDLNDLHRLWKNELGPVAREHSDDLWKRFQDASQKIHSKRQNFQKEIVSIQQENFKKKEIVISKMKVISGSKPSSHNEWQNSIKEFDKLKKEFQKIKNLKRNNNKKCWNDFRIVTKEFNTNKNNFYKNQKIELKKIIDIKKGLISEVENIINENKIAENTSRVKAIQDEWKKVGYLPRKISNSLWDEFRTITNKFYEILKSGAINLSKDEQKAFEKKSKFIDSIKFSKKKYTLDDVKDFIQNNLSEWNKLDNINLNSNNILNNNLNRKIISILRSLDLKNDEKDELSFDIEVELMKGNSKEINKKLQFLKRKISDLEDESNQFQNNLEFFSNSSTDNPLFKNVSSKIDSINSRIDFWKKRITKIEKIN
ncbi:MAG: DUF349 domain-containing protein [Bacteroidota bacterium]|nr:DUF349 domain-containing protein [Bacteroidota bacterium]MEC8611825.1 DUF349 domain-containing protein [Bacteroidota bacterium]|tara:strand:- start:938 stop:2872 length:1935 start_codon:yes stop_codon:yes gene_type:complete